MTIDSTDNSEVGRLQVDEFKSWPSSKFADPIEVEHGIRLAKPIAQAAQSWWSLRWLSIIQQFGLGVRWERAKQYAMRGQVLSIQIENGIVRSQVQGADQEPYRVIIAVKTIPKAIWTAIMSDFSLSSNFGIMVASAALPSEREIDKTFRDNGVLLFPDRQGEMQTKCSCLDWSNPCKHIAAVYLLLAAEFEKDPLLIFKLRGLSSSDLFELLNAPKSAPGSTDLPHVAATEMTAEEAIAQARMKIERRKTVAEKDGGASQHVQCKTTRDAKLFWKKSVKATDVLESWAPPVESASLPQSLGEFPFWQGNEEFLPSLRFVYEVASVHATQLLARTARSEAEEY